MKLSEVLNFIEDNDRVREALDDIADEIFVDRLMECRERLINSYENVKNGIKLNIYVVNDLEADAFQISLRIQSIDMILDEFKQNHEAYDFEAVEWWDDKDE